MAGMVRITATGEIIIGDKVLILDDLVFIAPDNIVDINGIGLLDTINLANLTDFNTLKDRVTLSETRLTEKADKIYVDEMLGTKLDKDVALLKSDITHLTSELPKITGPQYVLPETVVNYSIVNYNKDNVYTVTTTLGSIEFLNDGIFKITVKATEVASSENITISMLEPLKLRSDAYVYEVNITKPNGSEDQVLSNLDFETNLDSISGFEIL